MGTSTKLPGPVGGSWRVAQGGLTRSLKALSAGQRAPGDSSENPGAWHREEIGRHGRAYLTALARQLRAEPSAFGLAGTADRTGAGFAEALERLGRDGPSAFGDLSGSTHDEHAERFLTRFVAFVVGDGGLIADAAARRAAVSCGERLLARQLVPDAELGRLFLAGTVTELMTAVIAGKITLVLPVLPVFDPARDIAGWIGERIAGRLPPSCEGSSTVLLRALNAAAGEG